MTDDDLIRRGDALAAVQGFEYCWHAEEVIAALPPAKQDDLASGKAVTVRVKPLVWEERNGKSYRQANCVLGQYQVSWLGEFECWQLSRPRKAGQAWKDGFSRHIDKDAAKAEAQANYEARILAALEPAPNPAVTVGADAVLDAAHKYLLEQYGASPLAHPIDRARILALIQKGAAMETKDKLNE